MNALVDTTEMYLRLIYELEEEGVVPLRARIASGSGKVARPSARPWLAWHVAACSWWPVTGIRN